ncbi:MAG: hypothetical protein LBS07_04770 [Prevotellaceae bacterium]|jgi:hypothetical protein|nr:hypothetical protein [Prevotellaceae bacterium]
MRKQLLFFVTTALFLPWTLGAQSFPTISSGGAETWYSIYSHRSSKVINNAGIDVNCNAVAYDNTSDSQKWKFERVAAGTPDTFKIVNKTGGEFFYMTYQQVAAGEGTHVWQDDANEGEGGYVELTQDDIDAGELGTHNEVNSFVTATTGGTRFVFKNYADAPANFKFQLRDVDNESYVNQRLATDGETFCIYNVNNDGGNPFSVVVNSLQEIDDLADEFYASNFPDAPKMSTETNPVWYQINNLRKSRVFNLNDATAGTSVTIEPIIEGDGRDAQLFRFEGRLSSFRIVSKSGAYLKYAAGETPSEIIAGTSDDNSSFRIDRMTANTYKDKLMIYCIKPDGSATGVNGKHDYNLCLYDGTTDDGNAMSFIAEDYDPYVNAPKLSTPADPLWYMIKNVRSGYVLQYNEEAVQIYQATVTPELGDDRDLQLFRFEGAYKAGFKIVAKVGGELTSFTAESGGTRFQLSEGEGNLFKFIEKDAAAGTWAIQIDGSANGINAHNNNLEEVTTYSSGDAGSIWTFIDGAYNPYASAPKLSTAAEPLYYQVVNTRAGTALFYAPDAEDAKLYHGAAATTTGDVLDLQLFRFEGSYSDGFRMLLKAEEGAEALYDAETKGYNLTYEEGAGTLFKLGEKDAAAGTWAIVLADNASQGINADNNKPEQAVTTYNAGDAGSIWRFVEESEFSSTGTGTINAALRSRWSVANGSVSVWAESMNSVAIYSLTGATVCRKAASGDTFSATLSTNGCYIMQVTFADGSVENIKLLVK